MASEHGVNFIELAVGSNWETIVSGAVVGACLIAVAAKAKAANERSATPLIPDEGLTARNFIDLLASLIMHLGDGIMGKENRKFLPLIATLFTFIFFCNLLGLIPGFSMPTDSFTFVIGISLIVFVIYNTVGIRAQGWYNYFKHIWGPVAALGPLIFLIETISHFIRPMSLTLRLFINMTSDHAVLAAFTDFAGKFFVPVIFYAFGTFVCFIQAFVFTLLTMVYIRLAVTHDEEH